MLPQALLTLTLSLAALAAPAPAPAALETRQSCAPVHLLIARASTEAAGEGILSSVADAIVRSSKQTLTRESVDYPALLTPYDTSSQAGTAAVKKQLTAYVARCPASKVVLLGYSQGAHIIGDALCGGGGTLIGAKTTAIASSISDKVVAVVQMGDPRHTRSETYHIGTAIQNGLFPRTSDQSCERFAAKWRSYCDYGDPFCDSGLLTAVHLAYTVVYGTSAAAWVVTKIGG